MLSPNQVFDFVRKHKDRDRGDHDSDGNRD